MIGGKFWWPKKAGVEDFCKQPVWAGVLHNKRKKKFGVVVAKAVAKFPTKRLHLKKIKRKVSSWAYFSR